MAKRSKEVVPGSESTTPAKATSEPPRCLVFASAGINTSRQFAGFMSALITDLIQGRISTDVGNATCNAGGKLLKMVEMQHKYGRPSVGSAEGPQDLMLTSGMN